MPDHWGSLCSVTFGISSCILLGGQLLVVMVAGCYYIQCPDQYNHEKCHGCV